MNKLTYKEFKEEIQKRGLEIEETKFNVAVVKNDLTYAAISKEHQGQMTTYTLAYEHLGGDDRFIVALLSYRLAMTDPYDRVEPKRYYLKVCHRYMPFFHDEFAYLNIERKGKKKWINSREDTAFNKTIFTEEEFEELREEYDLSMFERVEVEDD